MKNKVGRPRLEIKRNIEVKFLVTEEEFAKLQELQEIHGAPMSNIIRSAVFGTTNISHFSDLIYFHFLHLPVIQKYNRFCFLYREQINALKRECNLSLYGQDEV